MFACGSVLPRDCSVSGGGSQFDIATLQAEAEERALAEIRERRYVTEARVVRSEVGPMPPTKVSPNEPLSRRSVSWWRCSRMRLPSSSKGCYRVGELTGGR